MKRFFLFLLGSFLVGSLLIFVGEQNAIVHAQDVPTIIPTYDPLAEPFIPENPSEFELGRNWYWHHCMPCHGDVGQGLTDEFRAIWPEDHQNCWGRGCHAGRGEDFGFPIPTVVPPLVSSAKLAKFSSQQALYDFLKATHPPQHPGYLSDEQYHAITFYVFTLNERLPVEDSPASPTPAPLPRSEPVETGNTSLPVNLIVIFVLGIAFLVALIFGIQKRLT